MFLTFMEGAYTAVRYKAKLDVHSGTLLAGLNPLLSSAQFLNGDY
jgi:hypothetical protein